MTYLTYTSHTWHTWHTHHTHDILDMHMTYLIHIRNIPHANSIDTSHTLSHILYVLWMYLQHVNVSATCECVCNMWMYLQHVNVSATSECICNMWMHLQHVNVSCHTYEWVMSHIWMSHVTHMNESCHTYEWVMSYIWMSRFTRTNESYICMSQVTHTRSHITVCNLSISTSHKRFTRHTNDSHVTWFRRHTHDWAALTHLYESGWKVGITDESRMSHDWVVDESRTSQVTLSDKTCLTCWCLHVSRETCVCVTDMCMCYRHVCVLQTRRDLGERREHRQVQTERQGGRDMETRRDRNRKKEK